MNPHGICDKMTPHMALENQTYQNYREINMPPETLVLNDTRYLQIKKANCKLMSKQRELS